MTWSDAINCTQVVSGYRRGRIALNFGLRRGENRSAAKPSSRACALAIDGQASNFRELPQPTIEPNGPQ
jgi:hypothetical protein